MINKYVIENIVKLLEKKSDFHVLYQFLVDESNKKASEIIVDALFNDTFYNVLINIKEVLRYSSGLSINDKFLTEEKFSFYQSILDIDKMSYASKIGLYHKNKDKNINLMFYYDVRKAKDISYKKIHESLIDISKHPEFKNNNLSSNLGVDIYDLREQQYFMLISCADKLKDKTNYKFGYYTLMSDKNTAYYNTYDFVYGYCSFPLDHVLHVFESDAGIPKEAADDSLGIDFRKVNRIMTPEEIVMNGDGYSEIDILNKKTSIDNEYLEMKPDFIVAIEDVEEKHIVESKRLHIPIVIIKKQLLKNDKDSVIEFYDNLDDYTNKEPESIEYFRRSHR